MASEFPPAQPSRVYRHHHLDSTRWEAVDRRADDIIITTAYKAGTTWMQAIVAALLFAGGEKPGPVNQLSQWVDFRGMPVEELAAMLAAQPHRRFHKTHLALDGFPYRAQDKVIYVGRDGRDVFMSLWNHYVNYSDEAVSRLNGQLGPGEARLDPCSGDLHATYAAWISTGSFPWDGDGFPYWSLFHHVATWWEARDLPNLLWVHYSDLLARPETEMRRIAAFLDIEVDDALWPDLVAEVSFANMRANGKDYAPGGGERFKGGSDTFLNKGTNGRWREVLDAEELALYDARVRATLPPEAANWLEHGRRDREKY